VYYSQVIVKKNTFNVILNKLSKKLKIFKVPFFFLSVSTFLSTITSRVSLFSGLFMFWFALSRSLSLPVSSHLSSLFFCVEVGCVWSKARLDAPCHRKTAHLRLLLLRTFALTLLSFFPVDQLSIKLISCIIFNGYLLHFFLNTLSLSLCLLTLWLQQARTVKYLDECGLKIYLTKSVALKGTLSSPCICH